MHFNPFHSHGAPIAGTPVKPFGSSSETAPDRKQTTAADRPHVLVVDDENLIADSVAAILDRNGYDAVARYSGSEALRYAAEHHPDIVVTDVMLPDLSGVHVALAVRSLCPNVRVVLFSGNTASVGVLELAASDGLAFELLSKPVHPATLLKALKES